MLKRVVALPMSTWRYKHQAENVRHMGPIAQDFFEAFQLGEDERRISTVDADGVAFAAIQGLNAKLGDALKIKDQEIASLRDELAAQKQALAELTDLKAQFVALKRDVQAAAVPTVALRQ